MICGVILAAGSSKRMGNINKLLLSHANQSMIKRTASAALASSVNHWLVVIGHQWEKIIIELESTPVTYVFNPAYRTGMSSSIRAAINGLPDQAEGMLLLAADQPEIASHIINNLLRYYQQDPQSIWRTEYANENGAKQITHPTLFPRHLLPRLVQSKDLDGFRSIFRDPNIPMKTAFTSKNLLDIDSPEEWKAWLEGKKAN